MPAMDGCNGLWPIRHRWQRGLSSVVGNLARWCGIGCALWAGLALAQQGADPSAAAAEAESGRAGWHAKLRWDTKDCPLETPGGTGSGVKLHALAGGGSLVEVACERWAYQGTYLFFILRGDKATPLTFRQFDAPDTGRLKPYSAFLVTGIPSVEPGGRTLNVLRLYRGFGDCGQYLRFALDGTAASLRQFRVNECAEVLPPKPLAPGTWPLRKLR